MLASRILTLRQRRSLRALARELDDVCPGLGARLCPRRWLNVQVLALSCASFAPCGTAAVLEAVTAEAQAAR